MASFSSWNGRKLHGDKEILTTVVKEKLGFNGFIVPIHSPEKICECLYKISDSVGLKEQLEVNCVETIKGINGLDYYGKQWDKLIKAINTK